MSRWIRCVLLAVIGVALAGCAAPSSRPRHVTGAHATSSARAPVAAPATSKAGVRTTSRVFAPSFTSAQNGAVIGHCALDQAYHFWCSILVTRDGGQTWSVAGPRVRDGSQLHFVNATFGFASSVGAVCSAGPCPTQILTTADGGRAWRVPYNGPLALRSLQFLTPSVAWAVGVDGTILESRDGGARWSLVFATKACAFVDLHFSSATQGWATGGNGHAGACLYRTTDAGLAWTPSFASLSGASVRAAALIAARATDMSGGVRPPGALPPCLGARVFFSTPAVGWLVLQCDLFSPGAFIVLRTTNAGAAWSYAWGSNGCCAGKNWGEAPVFFGTGGMAWRAQGYSIAKTTNGGKTWSVGAHLCWRGNCRPEVFFLDARRGWAATNAGLYATTDGGATWTRLSLNTRAGNTRTGNTPAGNGHAGAAGGTPPAGTTSP